MGSLEDLGLGWVFVCLFVCFCHLEQKGELGFGPRSVSKAHARSRFPVWWSRCPGVACSEIGLVVGEATPSL